MVITLLVYGNLIYKYKTVKTKLNEQEYLDYGTYEYKCKINPNDKKETSFKVKEKRIVTYNPKLAQKQKIGNITRSRKNNQAYEL